MVTATVVLALVAISAVLRMDGDQLRAGPALAPPVAPRSTFDIDPVTRRLSYAELSSTLPGPPFRCHPPQRPAPPRYRTLVTCTAPVHPNYNAAGDDWTALVGAAIPDASLVDPNDLKLTTDNLFNDLRSGFFGSDLKPKVTRRTGFAPEDVGRPGATYVVYGDVTVTSRGLPTKSDRLLVIVFRLADGQHVCYFSDRPNDVTKAVRAASQAALTSISVG